MPAAPYDIFYTLPSPFTPTTVSIISPSFDPVLLQNDTRVIFFNFSTVIIISLDSSY